MRHSRNTILEHRNTSAGPCSFYCSCGCPVPLRGLFKTQNQLAIRFWKLKSVQTRSVRPSELRHLQRLRFTGKNAAIKEVESNRPFRIMMLDLKVLAQHRNVYANFFQNFTGKSGF